MRLILRTPALVAYSELRYGEWRAVIERYAARRLGVASCSHASGRVSLALALTTYDVWLEDPSQDLTTQLDASMTGLRTYLEDSSEHSQAHDDRSPQRRRHH
jgi:hypothetical protein